MGVSVAKAMLTNTAGILVSRVFGLVRDILAAFYWGATEVMQAAFNTAFMVPNAFRSLFGEGAFSAAFVPALSKKFKDGKDDDAWRLACRAISLQIVALVIILVIVSGLSAVILYGFPNLLQSDVARRSWQLIPLLMPYLLFMCLAGSFGAILNSLRKFAVPALTPVIFNIVQIITIFGLYWAGKTRHEMSSMMWFCGSVLLAGFLQAAVLLLACRQNGFRFHFDLTWNDKDVKSLMGHYAMATISSGAHLLNVMADRIMVAWIGAVAVGALNYSNRLFLLPVGLFGAAMNLACLPSMSRANDEEMADCLDNSLKQVLFLTIPCMTLTMALATPLVSALFLRGAFTEEALRETVWTLALYLPGLPAVCAYKVAVTTFYGRQDTKTPMVVTIATIVLNVILNFCLIGTMRQGGLALASSITAWIQVLVLLVIDTKRIQQWKWNRTLLSVVKISLASCLAGGLAWLIERWLAPQLNLSKTAKSLTLLLAAGLPAMLFYMACCVALRENHLRDFIRRK